MIRIPFIFLGAFYVFLLVSGEDAACQVRTINGNIHVSPNNDPNPPYLFFENTTYRNGLPRGGIQNILQDSRGFMWFAVSSGLVRYDGYNYEQYLPDPTDSTSIGASVVWDICLDSLHQMWIATQNGLYRYEPKGNCFTSFPKTGSNVISKMGILSKYELLIGSSDGFWIFDLRHLKFRPFPFEKAVFENAAAREAGFPNEMTAITKDQAGVIWIAGKSAKMTGLFAYHPAKNSWSFFPFIPGFENDFIKTNAVGFNPMHYLYNDEESDCIWGGFWSGGLKRFHKKTAQWEQIFVRENDNTSIHFISRKSNNELWLGTEYGLMAIQKNTYRHWLWEHEPENEASLLPERITAFFQQSNGIIWLGGHSGISKIDPNQQHFPKFNILPKDEYVTCYLKDTARSLMFYATINLQAENHIYILDEKKRPLSPLGIVNMPADYGYNKIWFVAKDIASKGKFYWIGSEKGLFKMDAKTFLITAVDAPILNQQEGSTRSLFCRMGIVSPNGDLWIATITQNQGLIRYDAASGQFKSYLADATNYKSLRGKNFRYLYCDRQQRIWAGSFDMSGISIFDPRIGDFIPIDTSVDWRQKLAKVNGFGFAEDQQGNMWVGTTNGLFCCKLANNNQFSAKEVQQSHEEIYFVGLDSSGDVWVKTTPGIRRYAPRSGKWRLYDQKRGIDADFFNDRMYQAPDGEFFLGNYYRWKAGQVTENAIRPEVVISQFKLFEKSISFEPGTQIKDAMSFAYDQNFFTIVFSALSFSNPDLCNYAYQLEGFKPEWIFCGKNHIVNYTNLPPGSYVFKVKAANPDGLWSERISTMAIYIAPPFWGTWWFRMLIGLLIAGSGFVLYQNRVRKLTREALIKQQEAELHQKEAEINQKDADFKRKIAEMEMTALRAQMNPHFIFNCLNSINLFTLENKSEEASHYLTKFARLIRLVLENSKSEKVSLHNELEALRLYIEMEAMRFKEKLTYRIELDENIDTEYIEIPPLLIQPYVENAIWHGLMHKQGGGTVVIEITQPNENQLHIKIEDDGVGRKKSAAYQSKSALKSKSFGLKVTSDRLQMIRQMYQIHAQMSIEDLYNGNQEACGTRVILEVPI